MKKQAEGSFWEPNLKVGVEAQLTTLQETF